MACYKKTKYGKINTKSIEFKFIIKKIAEKEIQENAYFQNEDIQNVILELKEINHMTTSNLSEGMEIKIPIY